MKGTPLAEGFRGQALHFASADLRKELARHPLSAELSAPYIGWFPRALNHYRERPEGADENIFIYCTSGRGWFEIDGQQHELSRGWALLIPRGTPHRYGADESNPWSIHWAHFEGHEAPDYMSRLISVGYTIAVPPEVGRQIERLARESYHVLATGHTLRNFLLVAHSFRHLLGILLLKTGAFDGKSTVPPSHDFSKNIEFMHNNLSRPLALRELAKQAGLSPSRYSALFRAQTGTAPIEHHIGLRIHAACSLLVTSTLSIKEIAARLGYEDPLYFSRLFRKTMGTSPSDYRRGAKG